MPKAQGQTLCPICLELYNGTSDRSRQRHNEKKGHKKEHPHKKQNNSLTRYRPTTRGARAEKFDEVRTYIDEPTGKEVEIYIGRVARLPYTKAERERIR